MERGICVPFADAVDQLCLSVLQVFKSTKSPGKEQYIVLSAHLLWRSTPHKHHHQHAWKTGLCAGERGPTQHRLAQPIPDLLVSRDETLPALPHPSAPSEPFLCFSAPGTSLRLIAWPDHCTTRCPLALNDEGLGGVNIPASGSWAPLGCGFVMVHVALCPTRLISLCIKGLTSTGVTGTWEALASTRERPAPVRGVMHSGLRIQGDCRCRDTPGFCSIQWLWRCPICILLLKRRQTCTGRCTGSFERFSSAVVCHPK